LAKLAKVKTAVGVVTLHCTKGQFHTKRRFVGVNGTSYVSRIPVTPCAAWAWFSRAAESGVVFKPFPAEVET
jgi:hypothetical protein